MKRVAGRSPHTELTFIPTIRDCATCGEPEHGLCVLPCVYCQRPSVTTEGEAQCEACQDEMVRAAKRQHENDKSAGYGDWLRDQRKDEQS